MKVGDLVLDVVSKEHVLIVGERPCYQYKQGQAYIWDFEIWCCDDKGVYYADNDELEVINEKR
jgi:hypothetical protein